MRRLSRLISLVGNWKRENSLEFGPLVVAIGSLMAGGIFYILFKDPILAFFLLVGINLMISGNIIWLLERKDLKDRGGEAR